jgi:hypothetical protein
MNPHLQAMTDVPSRLTAYSQAVYQSRSRGIGQVSLHGSQEAGEERGRGWGPHIPFVSKHPSQALKWEHP